MARETLKTFLSNKGSTSDSISFTQKESPDGLGKDPGTGEELLDLINENKGLLGDYLNYITNEANNEYTIKQGNSLANSANRGDNLDIADNQGAEKIFVKQGTELKSQLNSFSNSNKFNESGTDLNSLIDKVGKNFSNHEKLKEIQGRKSNNTGKVLVDPNGEDNPIVKATQRMFLKNNRFANVGDDSQQSFTDPDNNINNFEDSEKRENAGSINVPNKFGVYDKESFNVNLDKLKDIAASLLLKSSGFDSGDTPENSGDPSKISSNINNLTTNQINEKTGFNKIENSVMRTKNAKGFPENEAGDSVRSGKGFFVNDDPEANNSKSFGQTYNTEFQFSNKNLKLHQIEAALSLIALTKISKSFFETFISLIRKNDKIDLTSSTEKFVASNKNADIGVYMLGKSSKLASLKISNLMSNLLTPTTYPYADAVERGLEIILGTTGKVETDDVLKRTSSVGQNPGFWLAVSKSILKTFDQVLKKYSSENFSNLNSQSLPLVYRDLLETNKFIQFYNVMAVIGDISLETTGGLKSKLPNIGEKPKDYHYRDVDRIPDNRAIPGKSRSSFGSKRNYKNNELTWSQDASPSMYLLPANIIKGALELNNSVNGANPLRGLFGSKLIKNTYTGLDTFGSYVRIPEQVVKVLEDKLEAEYVPFYLQDLRTNEIISFNAFLTDLTDTIRPEYNSISGYGRLDAVKIYKTTKRSITVNFNLIATNKEDFDAMWYKINKFVTLLYPQWTPGTLVSNDIGSQFYQPFSQVIGGTPVVRLRIGDVIKSNYSKFSLARTFGIGDENIAPIANEGKLNQLKISAGLGKVRSALNNSKLTDVILKTWLTLAGSPQSLITTAVKASGLDPVSNIGKITKSLGVSSAIQALSNVLVNGFANPFAVDEIIRQLRDPNLDGENVGISTSALGSLTDSINNSNSKILQVVISGYYTNPSVNNFRIMYLKPDVVNGYYSTTGKRYFFPRRVKVRILENVKGVKPLADNVIGYRVKIIDANAPDDIDIFSGNSELIVQHKDIIPDPGALFNTSVVGASLFLAKPTDVIDAGLKAIEEKSLNAGVPPDVFNLVKALYESDTSRFMRPEVNPIVRAYESTKGRGVAGVLNDVQFKWLDQDYNWETDYNSRAPMGCKISLTLDVIHDIPPGLDHTGFNRAPLYNVGDIMKNVAGDPYSDYGKQGEFNFRREGGKAARVQGGKN